MDIASALPTAVVTLREGVEAALIVGIVLACLDKAQPEGQLRAWVFGGVAAGLAGSALIGTFLGIGLQQLQYAVPNAQAILKPVLGILFSSVAVVMLSWMLLWMTQQAKRLKSDISKTVDGALAGDSTGISIFSLVCIAVLREGFEAVLFLFTQPQPAGASLFGVAIGLTGAILIGLALFSWGIRIDLKRFFQIMGVLLLLIVSGLVVSLCRNLDVVLGMLSQNNLALDLCLGNGPSCVLGPLVWDASRMLPDKQFPGIVLKVLLGYRDRIYLLQLLAYGLFLGLFGNRYFRSLGGAAQQAAKKNVSPT